LAFAPKSGDEVNKLGEPMDCAKDGAEAMAALQKVADRLLERHPQLTAEQTFAKAFCDANALLAARERRASRAQLNS
jgi:hypothetical protein